MQNYKEEGFVLEYTTSGAVAAGTVVAVGALVGVAASAATASGQVIAVNLRGVYGLPIKPALTIAAGDEVYWDVADGYVTETPTDTPLGIAWTGNTTDEFGNAVVYVKLVPKLQGFTQGVHVAHVATANATDLASAEALANANKVAINAALTALENAGLLASS